MLLRVIFLEIKKITTDHKHIQDYALFSNACMTDNDFTNWSRSKLIRNCASEKKSQSKITRKLCGQVIENGKCSAKNRAPRLRMNFEVTARDVDNVKNRFKSGEIFCVLWLRHPYKSKLQYQFFEK